MNITSKDFAQINTFGYNYTIDNYGVVFIDLPHVKVMIMKQPYYRDRERYGCTIEVKRDYNDKLNFDSADCFPRYFFDLQNLFNELHEWIKFNKVKIGIAKTVI